MTDLKSLKAFIYQKLTGRENLPQSAGRLQLLFILFRLTGLLSKKEKGISTGEIPFS